MKTLAENNPDLQDKESPNNLTLEAIEELESGGGKKFSSFKSMIDDLEVYEIHYFNQYNKKISS